jgi:CRISPR system Cascade subunit CasB
MTETAVPQQQDTRDALSATVAKVAALMASSHYPSGDRAALKRHAPGKPPPLAFYRLWLRHLGEELPAEQQTGAWALLAWGLALATAGSHQPRRALGTALAEAGFSESRLERLLAAGADTRPELFAALARFMASKGERFDWTEAARLLLTEDDDKREAVHRRIASSFYRQLHLQAKE